MIFTHLPHSAPTSTHRSSWKVRGLPTLIPFVTTGAQNLRTSPVVMTAESVPGQRTQPSVLGPKNPAGLFAAQGQLESRERAAIGLPKARGAGGGGCRAQFEEPERHSKAAAGRVAADPFVVAARGAQPPPPALARLRQERTLSLVLKVAASSAPSPGLASQRQLCH